MQKKLIFLSFGDIFTFPDSCAIQTNLGTKELLKKTVLENMGYWQNGLEIEKKVHYSAQASCFAAFRGIRDTKIEKSCGIQDKISL